MSPVVIFRRKFYMHITFLLPNDNLTGGTRVVATYARLLQARGHQVLVVCNAPPRPGVREILRLLRRRNWEILRQRYFPRPGHIALSGVLMRRLEKHRPIVASDLPDADVVVATWWETAVWMHDLPACKGAHVHLVQGYEIWGGPEQHERVHAALRLSNRKVSGSKVLKQEIEEVLGDLDMAVVTPAVDLDLFDAPRRSRQSPPTVGFIFAQTSIKGSDRCLRAIALARQQVPDLRVLAFGAQQPNIEWPLPPGTDFTYRPAQSLIPSLYARCDMWLFASRIDSFGLPILEAMACRTPVIGVPIGAAPDLLAQGRGVLLSGTTDEEALCQEMADAIVRLSWMPAEQWQAMSDAAYAQSRRYSWQDATALFEGLLQQAIDA